MSMATQAYGPPKPRKGTFVFAPVRMRNGAKTFELLFAGPTSTSIGMKNTSLVLTEVEFRQWLKSASPGDVIIYHEGFLALDADAEATRLPDRQRAELARVANCAWRAAEHGLIHLVQRRQGHSECRYIAIARAHPKIIRNAFAPTTAALIATPTHNPKPTESF